MTDITLPDGGMGQELVRRSGDKPTPLWATQVMIAPPGLVAEIHRDNTGAGATVATTNTYALHHDRLRGTPQHSRQTDLVATRILTAGGTIPEPSNCDHPREPVRAPMTSTTRPDDGGPRKPELTQ